MDASGVAAVLRAAEESRYYPALALIVATGLRKAEALALRWDRVDLDAGVVKVAATIARVDGRLLISEPKTDRSRRIVPLSPAVVAMLRKHKAAQAAEKLRAGAGGQWRESGLVFTTEFGTPSTRGICCTSLRRPPKRRRWRVSACTRCGTPRLWAGSKPATARWLNSR